MIPFDFIFTLKNVLKRHVIDINYLDSLYFIKTEYVYLTRLFYFIKHHILCNFTVLYDLSIVINPSVSRKKNKFMIYYYLTSLKYNCKIIVGSQVLNETIILESLFDMFKSSI